MINKLIKGTRLASEYCSGVRLRSIEHNPVSSHGTHHFSAQVHLENERLMKVLNDGRGGAHYYHIRKSCGPGSVLELTRLAKSFCQRARTEMHDQIVKDSCDSFAFVDVLICNLLNEQLTSKAMRKALRNRIHIIDLDKRLLYETDKRPTPIHLANSNKVLDDKHLILNELDEASQLKLWLTIN